MAKSPAWTRKEGQNPKGGLNAKGRASAKREGMNLKPPAPEPKTETAHTKVHALQGRPLPVQVPRCGQVRQEELSSR